MLRLLKNSINGLIPGAAAIPGKFKGVIPFLRTFIIYRKQARKLGKACPKLMDIFPQFDDRHKESGSIAQHYFYQDLWAARKVMESKTKIHYDVGSRIDGFIAHVSLFCNVQVIDIRPQLLRIKNVEFIEGDITNLPFDDESIASMSCLHAAEHIGLGRYGDQIDPEGTEKATSELQRVLKKNGVLYFSVPIGSDRIHFNAHRVFSPDTIISYFNTLSLRSFSLVTEQGDYIENANPSKISGSKYDCGLFCFVKV